jgi:rfaE bifunctional protein kinase chain/domain
MNFEQLFSDFSQIKVVVVGDVMLDTYWWGNVERISPEAPVPVVSLVKKEQRLGGAGNVALNTVALDAATFIISVVGKDDDGIQLRQHFQEHRVNTDFLVTSDNRITTNKTRVLSRNQQMMRLDAEMTKDLSSAEEEDLLNQVQLCFEKNRPQVLIFEDYNKGVLTERVIKEVTALCKEYHVVTAVDPKRKNFFTYKTVDIFKPNLKEVKEGLNLLFEEVTEESLAHIHSLLQQQLQHQISFITLSEKGVFFQSSAQSKIIPTYIRNIADVSGAGDTVIAVASLVYASTKNMVLAAEMANIAGGLVCEEVGTAAINKQKLLSECELLLQKVKFY